MRLREGVLFRRSETGGIRTPDVSAAGVVKGTTDIDFANTWQINLRSPDGGAVNPTTTLPAVANQRYAITYISCSYQSLVPITEVSAGFVIYETGPQWVLWKLGLTVDNTVRQNGYDQCPYVSATDVLIFAPLGAGLSFQIGTDNSALGSFFVAGFINYG